MVPVGPSEGVSMGLGTLEMFSDRDIKHGLKCPCVPASMEGTRWGHGGDMGHQWQSPITSQRGSRRMGGGRVQPGARVRPLPISCHPTATGFGHCSVNLLEVFGEKLAVAGAEPDPPQPEGMELVAWLGQLEMSWW